MASYVLNAVEPITTEPHHVRLSVSAVVNLGEVTGKPAEIASAMWQSYAEKVHARGELARRKLDILQMAAEQPSLN